MGLPETVIITSRTFKAIAETTDEAVGHLRDLNHYEVGTGSKILFAPVDRIRPLVHKGMGRKLRGFQETFMEDGLPYWAPLAVNRGSAKELYMMGFGSNRVNAMLRACDIYFGQMNPQDL